MCLATTKKQTEDFRRQHRKDEIIRVWKLYEKMDGCLKSPYQYYPVRSPGIVKSNRRSKKINSQSDTNEFYDANTDEFYDNLWHIYRGIHVYTDRKKAVKFVERNCSKCRYYLVIVCCHANMKDFVAYNDKAKEAVFMEVFISPRNFRRAMKGK